MKSKTEIDAEIAALKEVKPKVPHFNAFREDNHAAINAQILVLERQMNDKTVFIVFDDSNYLWAAEEALDWMNGEPESAAPSKNWQELVENLK